MIVMSSVLLVAVAVTRMATVAVEVVEAAKAEGGKTEEIQTKCTTNMCSERVEILLNQKENSSDGIQVSFLAIT